MSGYTEISLGSVYIGENQLSEAAQGVHGTDCRLHFLRQRIAGVQTPGSPRDFGRKALLGSVWGTPAHPGAAEPIFQGHYFSCSGDLNYSGWS